MPRDLLNYQPRLRPRAPGVPWIADPPILHLFFTIRALLIASTTYCLLCWLLGENLACFRFVCPWYVECLDSGLLLMQLDPAYGSSLSGCRYRPDVVHHILVYSGGHWPYARWITIPFWLLVPFWSLTLALVWRITRRKTGRQKR